MGAAPTDADGVQGRTKTEGSPGRILVAPGVIHFPKQLTWPAVFISLMDHTGVLVSPLLSNVLVGIMVQN